MAGNDPTLVYLTASEYLAELMYNYKPFGPKRVDVLAQDDVLRSCITKLAQGDLIAWAKDWDLSRRLPVDSETDGWTVADPAFAYSSGGTFSEIPREFWEYFIRCPNSHVSFEGVFNSFTFHHHMVAIPSEAQVDEVVEGNASGVHFCVAKEVLPPQRLENDLTEQPRDLEKLNRGGRPPAKWWADFAVELAVYIHEVGPPDAGPGDQAEIIDAVFTRMNENGRREGTRTAVQPVVNEVLRRIR